MITITPQGSVYLCKSPLENDYKNQLDFASASAQQTYFTGSSVLKHTYTDFTYIKKDNQIVVGDPIDTIIDCNYLFYKNTGFTTKYYYCFITNMEYVNENATRITFETDVYQTYMFDIVKKACFVEREHVNDDTIGKNLVEEGLEIGDLIIRDKVKSLDDYDEFCIVMGVTQLPGNYSGVTLPLDRQYNSVYSGLIYLVPSTPSDASKIIEMYEYQEQGDAIVEIFMYYLTNDISSATEYTMTHSASSTSAKLKFIPTSNLEDIITSSLKIYQPTDLDGYTPKNKKLFTSPYCFINADNNAGTVQQYKWELFRNNIETLTNKIYAGFNIVSCVCPGGSAKAIPQNYYATYADTGGVGGGNYMYSIPLAKLPACSWLSDTYTNWLTQNGISSTGIGSSLLAVGGGLLTQNYIGVAVGLAGIMTALGEIKDKKNAPDIVKGNANSGDINYAIQGEGGFNLYNMTITYSFAKRIDDFFSMFGYKVNEVKIPNTTGRTNWNYVKTIDCNFEGDIPQMYLNKIKEIFNNGITLWHNGSTFLDYSQSNNIVS